MSHGSTQSDINSKERAKRALQLRREGQTLEDIANACGYADKSGAYRAIKREIASIPTEEAAALRQLELIRLDYLETLCHKRIAAKETKDPLWAIDRLLAIGESRRKLLGLDIKVESDINTNVVVVREVPQGYLGEVKT
jgi:AraC-like DNA-binding protein